MGWKSDLTPKEVIRATAASLHATAEKLHERAEFLEDLLQQWEQMSFEEIEELGVDLAEILEVVD